MPLTNIEIKNAKPRAKPYKLWDGGSLYIEVMETGSKLWRWKYRFNKSENRFSELQFDYFFLQPMDGPVVNENTAAAIEYCKANPQWRLSIQMHKLVGIP